jgi:hypothetical protein
VTWRRPLTDPLPPGTRETDHALVQRYLTRLGRDVGPRGCCGATWTTRPSSTSSRSILDIAPLEKQALLEAATLGERARRLSDVLEFRIEELRLYPGPSQRAH